MNLYVLVSGGIFRTINYVEAENLSEFFWTEKELCKNLSEFFLAETELCKIGSRCSSDTRLRFESFSLFQIEVEAFVGEKR
jgi:hypothetical protein